MNLNRNLLIGAIVLGGGFCGAAQADILSVDYGNRVYQTISSLATSVATTAASASATTAPTEKAVSTALAGKQDKLTAGTGISISGGTISGKDATASVKGVVKVGTNIGVSSGTISVANATTSTKGVAKLGDLPIGSDGSGGTATMYVQM